MNHPIIDLDTDISTSSFGVDIDTENPRLAIIKIIDLIETECEFLTNDYQYDVHRTIYHHEIKYLDLMFDIMFSFDDSRQFVMIELNNYKTSTVLLSVEIAMNLGPQLLFVKNDNSNLLSRCKNIKPGKYLVNLAHRILIFFGFNKCILCDDSRFYISIPNSNKSLPVKLWFYHAMTKGCSWYKQFGYEPECGIDDYNKARQNAAQIRIQDINEEIKSLRGKGIVLNSRLDYLQNKISDLPQDLTIEHLVKDYEIIYSLDIIDTLFYGSYKKTKFGSCLKHFYNIMSNHKNDNISEYCLKLNY